MCLDHKLHCKALRSKKNGLACLLFQVFLFVKNIFSFDFCGFVGADSKFCVRFTGKAGI